MKAKYEVVTIDSVEVTVDISLLLKSDEMLFNATEMAKFFGKLPNDWLRLPETDAYIDAFLNAGFSRINSRDELITTKKGRYGGTWLHKELSLAFARWLSPVFAVHLDHWTRERIRREHEWRQKRLEARTGYLPMSSAINRTHDHPRHYHFTNEANLINRIVLGMDARRYCDLHQVPTVRDGVSMFELDEIKRLQQINTSLILLGMGYEQRKGLLSENHQQELR